MNACTMLFWLVGMSKVHGEDQLSALSDLYSNTNGDQWSLKKGWMKKGDPCGPNECCPSCSKQCDWYGVSCSVGGPDFILDGIELGGNSMFGQLPSSLSKLPDLNFLDFSTNQLTGPVPSELGLLTLLSSTFLLSSNLLEQQLPSELGLLSSLGGSFQVQANKFSGSIPSELGNLASLSCSFVLSDNSLCGDVPAEVLDLVQAQNEAACSDSGDPEYPVTDIYTDNSLGTPCCEALPAAFTCAPTLLPSPAPSLMPSSSPPTPNPTQDPTLLPTQPPTAFLRPASTMPSASPIPNKSQSTPPHSATVSAAAVVGFCAAAIALFALGLFLARCFLKGRKYPHFGLSNSLLLDDDDDKDIWGSDGREPDSITSLASGDALPLPDSFNQDSRVYRIKFSDLKLEKRPFAAGAGGMLFKGTFAGTEVACKSIYTQMMSDDLSDQFDREFRVLASLHHPNIVSCFGVSRDRLSGYVYTVQEFCGGGDLAKLIHPPPNTEDTYTAQRMAQICLGFVEGIRYMHDNGFAHRDLKPENCLLTSEGKVKICDMGLAKTKNGFGGRSSSAMTSGVGTMSYMPPEAFDEDLINSETYDPRSWDCYALGIILWQMWYREHPFGDINQLFLLKRILDGERPKAKSIALSDNGETEKRVPLGPSEGPPLYDSIPPDLLKLIEALWDGDHRVRPSINGAKRALLAVVEGSAFAPHNGELRESSGA